MKVYDLHQMIAVTLAHSPICQAKTQVWGWVEHLSIQDSDYSTYTNTRTLYQTINLIMLF